MGGDVEDDLFTGIEISEKSESEIQVKRLEIVAGKATSFQMLERIRGFVGFLIQSC
jgi:hypothetical protein